MTSCARSRRHTPVPLPALHPLRLLIPAVTSILMAAVPAEAEDVVLFDFEGPYLHDPGFSLKDHALFWSGTQWHCFYIRGDEFGNTSTEDELGHAVSDDLRNWQLLPPAIVAGPDAWDSRNVWAPMVIEDPLSQGQRRMLYTGADALVVQRLGAATTSDADLLNWVKSPQNPLLEPDPANWVWAADESFSSFRDPFYFFHQGVHHLLNTARVPDASLAGGKRGAIHHATSSDFLTWTDAGPLAVHNGPDSVAWHEIESVQVHLDSNGGWHLFFSETNRIGVFHTSSDSLESTWDIHGATEFDLGFAPEVHPVASDRYVFSRHAVEMRLLDGSPFAVIRVDSLAFDPNGSAVKIPFDGLGGDWPVRTGAVFEAAPTFGDNSAERGEAPTLPEGHGYLSSKEYYAGPVSGFGSSGAELGPQATGTMKSRPFTLEQTHVRLKVGGSNEDGVFVALLDAETDDVLFSARGYDEPTLHPVQWFVGNRTGTSAYLWVEDASTTGYINVDDVRLVTSTNVAPVATDDGFPQPIATDQDTAIDIDVLANDTDGDGQLVPASVTVTGEPANGTALVDPMTGTITYTPNTGFAGTEALGYVVSDDLGEPSNEATVFLQVLSPNADLGVDHQVDDSFPLPQQVITYTITATNEGPGEATGVLIADVLPAGVTLQAFSASQGTYDVGAGIWSVGALATGGSAVLDLTAVVDAQATGVIVNTASVAAKDQMDTNAGNDSSNALIFLPSMTMAPALQDSYIEQESPSANNGDDDDVRCLTHPVRSLRGLVQFDLSGIPAGATVMEATLRLFVLKNDTSGDPVVLHRVTAPWDEDTVTWSSAAEAFDPTTVHGSFLPLEEDDFIVTDLTGLTGAWIDGLAPNFGMMIMPTSNNRESRYATKEHSPAAERPRLKVTYMPSAALPVAIDDGQEPAISTPFQTPVLINVLANDTDSDGSLVHASVQIVSPASHGTTVVDTFTGEITYAPALTFSGSDSFQYTVQDDGGNTSNVATVFVEVLPQATAATPALQQTQLLNNVPNPFNPVTRLRFRLGTRSRVQLSIHDVRGRRTVDFDETTLAAGKHEQVWHGQDARGRSVASGVYVVVLHIDGQVVDQQRIVLVR